MKKTLLAICAMLSISAAANAQAIKIYKNDASGTTLVESYKNEDGVTYTAVLSKNSETPAVKKVYVNSISVAPTTVSIKTFESSTLIATVLPENATNPSVTWVSSDPSIAKVDANTGKVYGKAEGTTYITAYSNDGSTKASNVVTVTVTPLPDYVTITYGGKTLKWKRMNLGATTIADSPETSYGDYYTWGEVETYYTKINWTAYNAGSFTWKTNATKTHITGAKTGYNWQNYCNSTSAPTNEWSTAPYDANGILKAEYDVVQQNMDGWRMPTSSEFQNLCDACGGTSIVKVISESQDITVKGIYQINYNVSGITIDGFTYNVPGLLFVASESNTTDRLFFPFGGYTEEKNIVGVGSQLRFNSSTYVSVSQNKRMEFYENVVGPQVTGSRYYGRSIRPVCTVQ